MFIQYTGTWAQRGVTAFHPKNLGSARAIWESTVTVEDSVGDFPIDGEEVYSWIDQTSNLWDAQRDVSGPLYETTSTINSGEALTFTGDYLVVAGTDTSPLLSSTGDWHMFFVTSYNGGSSSDGLFSQGGVATSNNGHFTIEFRQVGPTLRTTFNLEGDGTYGRVLLNNDVTVAVSAPLLIEAKRVGADFTTIVNGNSASATGNAAQIIQQDGNVLGGAAGTWGVNYGIQLSGDIAAVYIYNSEITGTDYTDLTTYISNTWGV